jgi:hypothetical protein
MDLQGPKQLELDPQLLFPIERNTEAAIRLAAIPFTAGFTAGRTDA